MSSHSNTQRYRMLSISAHWCMFLLLIAVYGCMELRGYFPKGSDVREGLKTWHYILGLSVLALVIVRLMVRLANRKPPILPQPPRWQELFGGSMHVVLYGFMFGMPVLGWLILSAEGQTIPFFGLHMPALVDESKRLAEWATQAHELIAEAGYFLMGLHAVAALYHHYILRDNALKRMLPWRS